MGTNVWLMDRLAKVARSVGGQIMNNAARERLTTRSTNGRWVSGNALTNGSEHYPQGFGFACATLVNFLNDMDPDWTVADYESHVSQQLVIQDISLYITLMKQCKYTSMLNVVKCDETTHMSYGSQSTYA